MSKYLDWNEPSLQDHLYNLWYVAVPCVDVTFEHSDLKNDFEHFKQMYGFSPVWTFKCERKLDDWENDFAQWGQV
jgi:hypothetical protein